MSRNDYLWRVRCSETGDLVGDCGCFYCADEFELELDNDWSDDDLESEDEEEDWMADYGIE